MRLQDFDYALPPELVAQEPLPARDASRLLVLHRETGAVEHRAFSDLPELLRAGDLLVVNRSRVLPARLLGTRASGGAAEVLLVRDEGEGRWEAMVRPGRHLRPGQRVTVDEDLSVVIETEALGADGRRRVRLLSRRRDIAGALERCGHVPLPPYIRRPDRPEDRARYQTVYAREPGSVAAPTAGLHFTPELLGRLEAQGVARAEVVLHVGPGTFRPVTAEDVRDHRLEAEPFLVPAETAAAVGEAKASGRRVVAVGTTTVRALEAAAAADGTVTAGPGRTDLVAIPGFRFRVADALVTNFHLPRSSLLLLVSAFAGRERVLAAYAEAVRAGYRFYSYGDAMLVV
ncbi:MAG TPA: tRNA preQ1(34) S-adenosylmethionine ribosyltransferase-isomerase QueA [Vicinamibacteria bacterium]